MARGSFKSPAPPAVIKHRALSAAVQYSTRAYETGRETAIWRECLAGTVTPAQAAAPPPPPPRTMGSGARASAGGERGRRRRPHCSAGEEEEEDEEDEIQEVQITGDEEEEDGGGGWRRTRREEMGLDWDEPPRAKDSAGEELGRAGP